VIHALGRIEPATGLVVVGARPGARISKLEVKQGQKVKAGDILAILEGHELAEAQVALAEAQKARALHQRDVKKQELALEREQFDKLQDAKFKSSGTVLSSKALFDQIGTTYKKVIEDATLPEKEKLAIQLNYLEAVNQNLRDSLEVRQYQLAQELTPKKRKIEDEELADTNPDLVLLDRQIEVAKAGVLQTEIRAPLAGEILEINAHEGEVSSGPLLMMGDLSIMAVSAEVYQADLLGLKIDDPATIDILGTSVKGRVMRIGSMVSRNLNMSLDPRALQDRRVVKVLITLDDPSVARRFVNMEVEAAITRQGGAQASNSEAVPR
jgi:HlyD family secretion protein